jgi:hypothetical protein
VHDQSLWQLVAFEANFAGLDRIPTRVFVVSKTGSS